jgi:AcrR family transcriptional regulator
MAQKMTNIGGCSMGLRERKKAVKRQEIIAAGLKFFEARGFENVTVAQIAQEVNIAPKTLFTYFQSKDDIVFHDEDSLLIAIKHLLQQQTSIGNVWPNYHTFVIELATNAETKANFADIQHLLSVVAANETLEIRLLKMWAKYEQEITTCIVAQHLSDHNLATVLASEMVLPLRLLLTPNNNLTPATWASEARHLLNTMTRTQQLLTDELSLA